MDGQEFEKVGFGFGSEEDPLLGEGNEGAEGEGLQEEDGAQSSPCNLDANGDSNESDQSADVYPPHQWKQEPQPRPEVLAAAPALAKWLWIQFWLMLCLNFGALFTS